MSRHLDDLISARADAVSALRATAAALSVVRTIYQDVANCLILIDLALDFFTGLSWMTVCIEIVDVMVKNRRYSLITLDEHIFSILFVAYICNEFSKQKIVSFVKVKVFNCSLAVTNIKRISTSPAIQHVAAHSTNESVIARTSKKCVVTLSAYD